MELLRFSYDRVVEKIEVVSVVAKMLLSCLSFGRDIHGRRLLIRRKCIEVQSGTFHAGQTAQRVLRFLTTADRCNNERSRSLNLLRLPATYISGNGITIPAVKQDQAASYLKGYMYLDASLQDHFLPHNILFVQFHHYASSLRKLYYVVSRLI